MPEQVEQFKQRVEELVARFEGEVDRREWVTRRYPKRLRDDTGVVYEVPALYLQKGPTSLLLDPIGYDVPGALGAADLYLMPTYDPTASVYFEDGQWKIHYNFPPDPIETQSGVEGQPLALSTESINEVLNSIAEHAVPSICLARTHRGGLGRVQGRTGRRRPAKERGRRDARPSQERPRGARLPQPSGQESGRYLYRTPLRRVRGGASFV
jgi:hypothetical protein